MSSDPFLSERPPGEGLRQPSFKISVRQLGVVIFFISLTVLFGASIVGYVLTRTANDVWRTHLMPALPLGLIGSTGMLVGVSGAVQYALVCARKNRFDALNRALALTFLFALAFLVGQAFNWSHLAAGFAPGATNLYAFTFYLLTGLHALHVLGGLVPLVVLIAGARRKEYTSSRHEGVKLCAQYWHFLGVVWLVLLAVLYWGSAS
jgi:cytochrome c oxidase subunit 3